jgi:imidazole glycerol-phosphate synthase subunit HisF
VVRRRIIPALLLKGSGLVKTVKFRSPSYLGDPINVFRIFNEKGVDEVILSDIEASRTRARPNFALIEQIVSEAFMPVCYGGGIRSVEDGRQLLKLGLEKLSINTAALTDLSLIRRLSDTFGAQCVVASVDVTRTALGGYRVFSHAGAPVPVADPLAWAEQLVRAGCGEVFLNAVHRDGTMSGYDLDLLRLFDGKLSVPLIACGGAGSVEDMIAALKVCRLSGLAVGARFVYYGPHRAVLVRYLAPADFQRIEASAT